LSWGIILRRFIRLFFIFTICILFIVCAGVTVQSQGFDVLRLTGTQISGDVNFKDGVEIYQFGSSIQLQVSGHLTLSRNLSPIRTAPPKITKNLIIHIGVYQLPPPNGGAITPNTKRTDTSKTQPEYENEFPTTISTETPYNFPITFLAPKNEGVYEIIVSLYTQNQTPLPRSFTKPDLEIIKQIIVVNPESKQNQQQNQNQQNINHNTISKELIEQNNNNTQKNEWWKPNLKRLSTIPSIPSISSIPTIPTPKLPGFIDRNFTTNIAPPPDNFRFAINKKLLTPLFDHYANTTANAAENNNVSKTENNNIILHPPESNASNAQTHAWRSVPLNLNETGKPHLIEIDYPANVIQKLELAVVETVDNEHVVSAESCIHVTKTIGQAIALADSSLTNTHRILFWSKTKSPVLLLVNRTKQNCVFGNIRLYKITSDPIPRQYKILPKRLVAAYLNRPETLLQLASTIEKTEIKSESKAESKTDAKLESRLDSTVSIPPKNLARDWQPLYESANRLVEILNWNGFDGIMLNVYSKDAILYRTNNALAQTESPRDLLELLHRLFDRETLSLIPAINFNMRLQKIDAIIQNNPRLAAELLQPITDKSNEIININANHNANINVTINNLDPQNQPLRYNFLHPLVREVLLGVICEIAAKYGKRQSFGGIGVIVSHDSHTLLNEPLKSLDDWTIGEFTKETGTLIPDAQFTELRDRIDARAKFFRNNNSALEAFVNWRNVKVKEFYQDAAKMITGIRRDARLYLAADSILDQPDVMKFCLPTLPRSGVVLLSQRMLGYDAALICGVPSVTFLRPSRRSPEMQNAAAAVYSDFDAAITGSQFIRDGISFGALFFNDPAQSPTVPTSIHNRSRFVKHLSQSDVAMFFDGGNSFLSGENDSLLDLFAVFRQLPPLTFKTFTCPPNQNANAQITNANTTTPATATTITPPPSPSTLTATSTSTSTATAINPQPLTTPNPNEKSLQPVIVRYVNDGAGLFVYIVNDAPFSVRVDMDFKVAEGAGFYELSGRREFETGTWQDGRQRSSFRLEAYNLAAVYVNDAAAAIDNVDVMRPEYICGTNGILHKWVEQLAQRIQIARAGIRWDKLNNAGFDDENGGRASKNFKKIDMPKNIWQNPHERLETEKYEYEYAEYNGWQSQATKGATANIDAAIKHEGNASLRLTCTGVDKNICVSSEPFELPETGRLFVSFFIGIKGNPQQNNASNPNLPASNLITTSTSTTASLTSTATTAAESVLARLPDNSGLPLLFQVSVIGFSGGNIGGGEVINRTFNMDSILRPILRGARAGNDFQWYKVVVPFDRLLFSGGEGGDVILRFSLSGVANVWVDDITLYNVAFTPEETNELFRLLSAADVRRLKYRVSDLMMLFDSYWVQFLLQNTPDKSKILLANKTVTINTNPAAILSNNTKLAANIPLVTPPQTKQTPPKKQQKTSIIQRVKSWITF
jgi:hypothetical protein